LEGLHEKWSFCKPATIKGNDRGIFGSLAANQACHVHRVPLIELGGASKIIPTIREGKGPSVIHRFEVIQSYPHLEQSEITMINVCANNERTS
jgi:hypothetical protein